MIRDKQVLLLDLGGVLADLGDPSTAMQLAMSSDQFWDIWLGSLVVQAYETGLCNTAEFASKIARELGVSDSVDFEMNLRNWQITLYPEAEEFLRSVSMKYQLALLSNTNELHWSQIQSSTQISSDFSKLFLSFETGKYKPFKPAFKGVLKHFDCDPVGVIFLDDNDVNVLAAREVGFQAFRVDGIAGAERAILDLG